MATNHSQEHGDSNPSVRFDKSDLSARGILVFFTVMIVFFVAMSLTALGLWVGLSKVAGKHDPEGSPLVKDVVTPRSQVMMNTANVNLQKFPEPRFQHDDAGDMERFQLQQAAELTAEPWQDQQGKVHLPIDQAMQLTLGRLNARQAVAAENYPGAGPAKAEPAPAEPETAEAAPAEQK